MKKQANKEVFQSILENFRISLADLDFIDENKEFFSEESDLDLQLSIEKLRTKYNNIKKRWRAIVDRAKVGSGLNVAREPLLSHNGKEIYDCFRFYLSSLSHYIDRIFS